MSGQLTHSPQLHLWRQIFTDQFTISDFYLNVTLDLTYPVICILLYIPSISFFMKDILFSFTPFSHTFPTSSCSPFLFLSSVLIEIQLCNSLSEDTIDLSTSCVFEEHRQEEKDGGKRDGWTETERGREEQEAGRERDESGKKIRG